ncbi:MAG: acyl-ACP--UDP-N-acetylglucosamine O-acyltransferase [Desulfobacteraceae bacterium]|nr:acyl-ACP--UDP-N-acetylglucosamine O-acyltransferase [Desulfobacteraceae bacterium]
MKIHPTAIIDPTAEIDSTAAVGPYAVIGPEVRIGAGCEIGPHAVISGPTTMGAGNRIGAFASIGGDPQDLKFQGERVELVMGDNNTIREYVSIHRGTASGHRRTTIGSDNLFMAYAHVAHDCVIGNRVILANAATLGGHVEIADKATLGGLVAVHQFTRIGAHAYIGGMSGISKDIPPYIIVAGIRNQMRVTGINKVGLQRSGFDEETIRKLSKAFRIIFRTPGLLLEEALEKVQAELPDCGPVQHLVAFFRSSSRPVVRASGHGE